MSHGNSIILFSNCFLTHTGKALFWGVRIIVELSREDNTKRYGYHVTAGLLKHSHESLSVLVFWEQDGVL